ncbi:MAG: hypothetical protein RL701_2127 [Pseudomonadota bacterium]|jgi:3-oxoacyl-[acyl-carrier-protein] synthase-1
MLQKDASPQRLADGSEIVITGRGLVGALGLDVVTACAAFRAGLSRASLLEEFHVKGDGHLGTPLIVHAVRGITDGFEGPLRLQRLLAAGFEDLFRQTPELAARAGQASLFVALPEPGREFTGATALAEDDPERAELQDAAKTAKLPKLAGLAAGLVEDALLGLDPKLRFASVHVISAGHASMAQACLNAAELLRRQATNLAVVISADSLLDVETLGWLKTLRRLRTEQRPAGVVVGEGCAVLVLERKRDARDRKATVFAELGGIAIDHDPSPLLSGEASKGLVMANLIHSIHGAQAHAPWVLLEHNGEAARAAEWGNSLFHLRARAASYADTDAWFPAIGFGDTGAASGAVAACIALAAWERKYAPRDSALICSRSDGTPRSVLQLKRVG